MEVFDILLVGIEASIALAGFSGVIATFQLNDTTKVRRSTVAALTVIVQFSLVVALYCAIPLFLHTFEVKGATLWAVSSVFGAIMGLALGYRTIRDMKGAIAKKSSFWLFLFMQGLGVLVVFVLILNAADLIFHREPGPYILSVIYALSVAGFMFARLLLLPQWRIVREQEARNSKVTSSE